MIFAAVSMIMLIMLYHILARFEFQFYGGPKLLRQNKKSRQNEEKELVSGCYLHLKWYVV